MTALSSLVIAIEKTASYVLGSELWEENFKTRLD